MFIEFCTALNESTDYQGGQKFHLEKTFLSSMELPVSRFPENPKKAKKSQQTETDFGVLFGRSGAKPKTQTPHGFPDTNTCLRKEDALIWIFAQGNYSVQCDFFLKLCVALANKNLRFMKKIYRRLVDGWGPTLGSKPESRIKSFCCSSRSSAAQNDHTSFFFFVKFLPFWILPDCCRLWIRSEEYSGAQKGSLFFPKTCCIPSYQFFLVVFLSRVYFLFGFHMVADWESTEKEFTAMDLVKMI